MSVCGCLHDFNVLQSITGVKEFRRFISGILILLSTFSVLHASRENWRVIYYGQEHGLSQISVNSIFQDSYGFLWVGTRDGLNRFDGYEFTVFRHQSADIQSISNSYIHSVIEDNEGNIWVGTKDGLNKYERKNNAFSVYRRDPGNNASNSGNNIYNVYQDRYGIIWIQTETGLDNFDPGPGIFNNRCYFEDTFKYSTEPDYFSIYEDNEGRMWIGSQNGLFLYDRDSELFSAYHQVPGNKDSLSNNKIRSVFETSAGHLLIGTEYGLNIFDVEKEAFSSFYIDQQAGENPGVNVFNTIFETADGQIWVGTGAGLFNFIPEDGHFISFNGIRRPGTFHEQAVYAIFEDRSMNLWIGTSTGLFMLDTKSKFGTYSLHDYMPDAPVEAMFVTSVLPHSDQELWLGTLGAGLFLLNRKTGEIIHFSANYVQSSKMISNDVVQVIFADSRGRIILGTNDGLQLFKGYDAGFETFCPSDNPDGCSVFESNKVFCIFEDSEKILWVGTRHGLHSFNADRLMSYYHNSLDSASISSNQIHDIAECNEGFIWLATSDGLNMFDKRTGNFKSYRKDPEKGRFSLSNNELTSLLKDSKGNLWVGSVSGLNRFFDSTGSFMVFTESEGLPSNMIHSILEDNNGNLWISTNNGLAKLDPGRFEILSFEEHEGFQSYEFTPFAGFKDDNGEMFFGGATGLTYFFPDVLKFNETVPPVIITSFEVISPDGNRLVFPEDKGKVILPLKDNSFNIEFSALDFTSPAKNRYAYKLEGLYDNWINSGTRRIANFSGLTAGSYKFTVKGSNNDGIWNEEGFSITIVIINPWWKSVYAYIIYSASLVILVYVIILYSTRRLRTANQILMEKEQVSAEIKRQKEELIIKNRNITDSIKYAKRIQLAMMPTLKHFRRLFPESFVYYKPKDIISGDFYWVNQKNDKVFLAVVDCTGHGVPGAFMSIIGYELLRNIINKKGVEKPADILNILNKDFAGIFNSGGDNDFSFRDGMDIGFCVIDKKKANLEFAGAFSTLFLVRNMSIVEIKGNRFSVGLMEDIIDEPFKNHSMSLEKDDMIYLFSDGYTDQFGGEEGKKFKYRRFRHLLLYLHKLPAREQVRLLEKSIVQWMGDNEQVDDILVLGVKPALGRDEPDIL